MKMTFLEPLLGIGVIAVVAFCAWYIIWTVKQSNKSIREERQRKAELDLQIEIAKVERLSQKKKWEKSEIILLAYIVLYDDPDNEAFIEAIAEKLERTKTAVQRKIRRLQYEKTDSASKLDKKVLRQLEDEGSLKSLAKFKEACLVETGSTQWIWKFINS